MDLDYISVHEICFRIRFPVFTVPKDDVRSDTAERQENNKRVLHQTTASPCRVRADGVANKAETAISEKE